MIELDINMPIEAVVDITWRNRDQGGDWLIVERGWSQGQYVAPLTYKGCGYSNIGVLVQTHVSKTVALGLATKMTKKAWKRGIHLVRYDVVNRNEVVIQKSSQAYGVFSGQHASSQGE